MQQGIYRSATYPTEDASDVIISPNPTNGSIKITTQVIATQLVLYDIYSQQLFIKHTDEKSHQIILDLHQYNNGVYYLKIVYLDGNDVIKPIILLK
ncbi:MAG: T9SS type A sorting domain-containing protein [Bacteroidetes bacterium]|nr:T9SS type A sorting domain-containing protein [Bacteroidota bacterium]